MRVKLIMSTLLCWISLNSMAQEKQSISREGMTVSWYYQNNQMHIEMEAPTEGWVTLGFNTTNTTKGAYLLMGNVINGKVNLVEHYTESPGNYAPISSYGVPSIVENITGQESGHSTKISFSLPLKNNSKYRKSLYPGAEYYLILAYSRDDDFQHHSMMRTSVFHKL